MIPSTHRSPTADLLEARPVVLLDGAVAGEIARRGGALHPVVWSALAHDVDPELVRGVHEAYLGAGADVVTANTFATSRHVLAAVGRAAEAPALTRRAVEIARSAVERSADGRRVLVAGSLSNTLAWRSGTFAPDPRFVPDPATEAESYREAATALAGAGADLILLEMMRDVERASLAAAAAKATGLDVWIGLSASLRGDGSVVGWDLESE
ncbi:MAG: homocysteine S-methyltransferase family protein, partial [Thermoanaerobaculia bacterium]|nr:homocysteine S-methyltransferase family protein [Thermoanaerobaculia bacterium]